MVEVLSVDGVQNEEAWCLYEASIQCDHEMPEEDRQTMILHLDIARMS